MAIVDAITVLSDKQVLDATTYSQRAIDFQTLADYGTGRDLYVHFIAQGTHAKDLRIQVLGLRTTDDATPIILGDSGVIPRAELVQGGDGYVRVSETRTKWRYLVLRYIPTDKGQGSETVVGGDKFECTCHFNEPVKVGETQAPIANAIRAQIEFVPVLGNVYPCANADKSYTA